MVAIKEEEPEFIAAMPLYAKYHSYGEFIFDQTWAEFAEMALDIKYYPKVRAVRLTSFGLLLKISRNLI